MVAKSLDERVTQGRRMQEFLRDDAVNEALALLERQYYEEFRKADTSDKRVTAWAKANVLADFQQRLLGVVDDAELAVAELQVIAQHQQARRTGRSLPHE